MTDKEYPRSEQFEEMREKVDAAFLDSSDVQVHEDIDDFYDHADELVGHGEDSEGLGSEANQIYLIAMFQKKEAESRLADYTGNKGTAEKRYIESQVQKLDRRQELLHELIDPEATNQTVAEMLEQVRDYITDIKNQTKFGDQEGQRLLNEYEELESFLVQFGDSTDLNAFREDNFSYRNWLETGEIE